MSWFLSLWNGVVSLFGGRRRTLPPAPFPVFHTEWGVTINDFTSLSPSDLDALVSMGIKIVRFDLAFANEREAAATRLMVAAVRAAGLEMLGISPYVSLSATPNQFLFDKQAEFVGSLVSAGGFWGIELMNEPNKEAPLSEKQLTPSQYMDYASTIAKTIVGTNKGVRIISGGTSGYDAGWMESVKSIYGLVDYIGVHPYGVPERQFGAVFNEIQRRYGRPAAQTEWAGTVDTLPVAIASSRGVTPVFIYFNLDALKGSPPLADKMRIRS